MEGGYDVVGFVGLVRLGGFPGGRVYSHCRSPCLTDHFLR